MTVGSTPAWLPSSLMTLTHLSMAEEQSPLHSVFPLGNLAHINLLTVPCTKSRPSPIWSFVRRQAMTPVGFDRQSLLAEGGGSRQSRHLTAQAPCSWEGSNNVLSHPAEVSPSSLVNRMYQHRLQHWAWLPCHRPLPRPSPHGLAALNRSLWLQTGQVHLHGLV